MKTTFQKAVWLTLIVAVSLILLAVILGVLNGTVGKGQWQIGIQTYRYEAEATDAGGGTVYATELRALDVDWINGDVEIYVTDDDRYVSVTEVSEEEILEKAELRWWMDAEGRLVIKCRESGSYLPSSMPQKKLILRIPREMMASLEEVLISTVKGNVTVFFPEDVGFSAELKTGSGQVLSDFDLDTSNGAAVYGDGGISISVTARRGELRLRRAD